MYDIDKINFSLSENIETWMKKKKINRARLAQMTGISYSAIHMWSIGSRTPGFESVLKLANAFDITIDELIGAANG